MGEERSGDGPARLGLEDRCLDLDEVLGLHVAAHSGNGGEADLEHLAAVRVGQKVDFALAVAGVCLGQAVPLVGQWAQRLRQEPQLAGVDGELAAAAGDDFPFGADPVAEVDRIKYRGGLFGEYGHLQQQLDGTGHIGQRGKGELPVAAHRSHPAREADLLAGADIRVQTGVALLQVAGQRRPIEPRRVGVDPLTHEGLALLAAFGHQCIERGRCCIFHGLVSLVGHGCVHFLGDPGGGLRVPAQSAILGGRARVALPVGWIGDGPVLLHVDPRLGLCCVRAPSSTVEHRTLNPEAGWFESPGAHQSCCRNDPTAGDSRRFSGIGRPTTDAGSDGRSPWSFRHRSRTRSGSQPCGLSRAQSVHRPVASPSGAGSP